MPLLRFSRGRWTDSDDNDALQARGCRRISNTSSLVFDSSWPNTSGSSRGCLSTSGAGGGIVIHGLVLDGNENEVALIKSKWASHASVQHTTGKIYRSL